MAEYNDAIRPPPYNEALFGPKSESSPSAPPAYQVEFSSYPPHTSPPWSSSPPPAWSPPAWNTQSIRHPLPGLAPCTLPTENGAPTQSDSPTHTPPQCRIVSTHVSPGVHPVQDDPSSQSRPVEAEDGRRHSPRPGAHPMRQARRRPPPSNLGLATAACVLFCPLGIIALVYAGLSGRSSGRCDFTRAKSHARTSLALSLVSLLLCCATIAFALFFFTTYTYD